MADAANPFAEDWPAVTDLLATTPGLQALTVLEVLTVKHPGRYDETHLRTLQRRVRRWRAEHGPAREVWFTQAHRPGEAAQTDFTSTAELGVTLAGQMFAHLLCVTVLPYSNWQWATVCASESLAALRRGVQAALFPLGACRASIRPITRRRRRTESLTTRRTARSMRSTRP